MDMKGWKWKTVKDRHSDGMVWINLVTPDGYTRYMLMDKEMAINTKCLPVIIRSEAERMCYEIVLCRSLLESAQ